MVTSTSSAPASRTILLVNQISRHGHLDLYARIYSACLLELGYRVVLVAECESGVSKWIAENCGYRTEDFFFFARTDFVEITPAQAIPPLLLRIRRVWKKEGMKGMLLRILVRVQRPLRFLMRFHRWSALRGVSLPPLVDEIRAAANRLKVRPELVFFLYLDMINDDRRGCRALAKRLGAPWAGILFDPRCSDDGRGAPERFFRCRNARGAGFLNPHAIAPYRRRLPLLRFGELPDVTDASLLPSDSPLLSRLRSSAGGRQIVLQFGSLSPHKGVTRLVEVIRRADPRLFFFAIVGEFFWGSYGKDEQALRSFVETPPENCLVHSGYIEDERELNSIVAAADIVYAVYTDFRPSSNTLTKAAMFNKPVVVSNRHLMGERVHGYRTGATVASGNIEEIVAALETLRLSDPAEFGFAAYRRDHSVEALKKQLAVMLEGWLQPRGA